MSTTIFHYICSLSLSIYGMIINEFASFLCFIGRTEIVLPMNRLDK